jgi:hypothetical protein
MKKKKKGGMAIVHLIFTAKIRDCMCMHGFIAIFTMESKRQLFHKRIGSHELKKIKELLHAFFLLYSPSNCFLGIN